MVPGFGERNKMLGIGGVGRGTRRIPPLPPHGAFLAVCLLPLICLSCVGLCRGRDDGIKCIEREREALLAVRADITWVASTADDKWLSHDCCRWKGVECDNHSGHVVKLDHHYTYSDLSYNDFGTALLALRAFITGQSKVSPALLNLTSLRHLDLSDNDFGGAPIPDFIGSLVNLEYLNLSRSWFAGSVPPQLGSLRNLRYLDLSALYDLKSENLQWLSHLSHLEYLDMSGVDLSAVTDWLQVINMLPSLSVLRLSYCRMPNLPTALPPHFNFTSLSTLDLSTNYFNSSWPLWLFNLTSLLELDLSFTFSLRGPIPDSFGNLKHLEVLSLGGNDFEGVVIPGSLWTLDNLKVLRLSGFNLRIGFSKLGEKLSTLQELELDGVNGRLPDSLVNLRRLSLWHAAIELPESLGNLSHLESLSLSYSNITEGIPESLGNLVNLKDLSLAYNHINGRIPESLGNLSHLESLSMDYNDYITGGIPESVGNLVNLKTLSLSRFNISREVLRNMGDLCNLTRLSVHDGIGNGVEVTDLLKGLSQCTGGSVLEYLDLRGNGFGGHLPEQVGQLNNLEYLFLSDNKLSGLVPSSIGKLSNLKHLDISSNSFEGVLSGAHFSNLSRLDYVDMSYNAALSLKISWAWVPPFQLSAFRMRACHVGPEFPKWLQTQKSLGELDLSYNVIQDTLLDNFFNSFPLMYSLNLSHNQIEGFLPFSLSSAPFTILDLSFNDFEASQLHLHAGSPLRVLDLSNNHISGPIFVSTGEFVLAHLNLSQNNINGTIPLSICQIKSLQILDLSYNHFSGGIPGCWEDNSLIFMKLSCNQLVGLIPSSLGTLLNLTSLHLDKNNFTGVISSSLKYCVQLVTLDLGENNLSGEIPTWLGESLSSLQILRLRSNMLYGNIPMSLSQLQSLRVLDLACNRLTGTLHLSFHNLSAMIEIKKAMVKIEKVNSSYISYRQLMPKPKFEESIIIVPKGTELEYTRTLSLVTIIDLSGNNLSGHIPEEIVSLKGLHFLNLSRNHLEGKIPTNISTMLILESLDLSFNQLSGNIPLSISDMHFLSRFNVSYNNLSGKIPSGSQLQTFDQSSYIGNPDLCGAPLLRRCPNDVISQDPTFQASDAQEDKHEPYMIWLYIGMGTGFAAGFWGFFGVLLLVKNKRVAWFRFIDFVADELYVMIVVHFARLKLKISS